MICSIHASGGTSAPVYAAVVASAAARAVAGSSPEDISGSAAGRDKPQRTRSRDTRCHAHPLAATEGPLLGRRTYGQTPRTDPVDEPSHEPPPLTPRQLPRLHAGIAFAKAERAASTHQETE